MSWPHQRHTTLFCIEAASQALMRPDPCFFSAFPAASFRSASTKLRILSSQPAGLCCDHT